MSKVVEAVAEGIMAVFTYGEFAASNFWPPFFYLVAYLNIMGTQCFLDCNNNLSF